MAKVTLHATIFGEDGIKTRDYETALIPDAKNQEMQVINLYPDKTYQKIEGFGAALTESAGYALSRMSEENRKKVVEAYYGKDGIGYTIGRIHMDSCDFSIGNYCAVESPDDPEFRDFSLERDAKYVQPLVKAVPTSFPERDRRKKRRWPSEKRELSGLRKLYCKIHHGVRKTRPADFLDDGTE